MDIFDQWLQDESVSKDERLKRQRSVIYESMQLEIKNGLLGVLDRAQDESVVNQITELCRSEKPITLPKLATFSTKLRLKPRITFEFLSDGENER